MNLDELKKKAATLAAVAAETSDADEELALLADCDRSAEIIADKTIRRELLKAKRLCEQHPGKFRPGVFRFGDGAFRSGIVFRNMTPTELKVLREAEPGQATIDANRRTFVDCVLWCNESDKFPADITPDQERSAIVSWLDAAEKLYPSVWGEAISRWAQHAESEREETRGKA